MSPWSAPRPCAAPGCREVVRGGPRCPVHQKKRAAELRANSAPRPNSRRRGAYDHDWEKLRRAHLAQHPECVFCGGAANTVDHIRPWRAGATEEEREAMRLDPEGLQSCCASCHSRKTATRDGGFGRARL